MYEKFYNGRTHQSRHSSAINRKPSTRRRGTRERERAVPWGLARPRSATGPSFTLTSPRPPLRFAHTNQLHAIRTRTPLVSLPPIINHGKATRIQNAPCVMTSNHEPPCKPNTPVCSRTLLLRPPHRPSVPRIQNAHLSWDTQKITPQATRKH